MKITIDNYEIFAIDYIDGILDEADRIAFENFLVLHPEIAEEVQLLIGFTPGDSFKENLEIFPKDLLLQDSTLVEEDGADVLDDICIDVIEHQYDQDKEKRVRLALNSDELSAKRLALYEKTKLIPDYELQYPDMSELYKQQRSLFVGRKTVRYALLGAAASVMLFVGVQYLQKEALQETITRQPQMAMMEKAPDKSKPVKETPVHSPEVVKQNAVMEDVVPQNTTEKKQLETKESSQVKENKPTKPIIKIGSAEPLQLAKAEKVQVGFLAVNEPSHKLVKVNTITLPEQPIVVRSGSPDLGEVLAVNINKVLFRKNPDLPEAKKISLWDVAELGVKGVNKITGSDIEFEKEYDEQGNISYLALRSGKFAYEKKSGNKL